MRDHDVMRKLAADNPVPEAHLAHLDPAAGAALREGIVMSAAPERVRTRRQLSRRGLLAGGLAIAMVGGGLAYAGAQRGWYEQGGGADGLTCLTQWFDPTQESADEHGVATGGPAITGDPIADCQEYQRLSDRPPIDDPVAFRWDSPIVYVAPQSEVPSGAELLAPTVDADPVHELWLSVNDLVAGLGAQCLDEEGAAAAAEAELSRLGLTDWTVEITEPEADRPTRECAGVRFVVDPVVEGPAADDARARTLVVVPHGRTNRDDLRGNGVDEFVFELRDTLRSEITKQCVDVAEARAIVLDALGPAHHWPTGTVIDEDADCTRAYLVSGGSVQVTLYGPQP